MAGDRTDTTNVPTRASMARLLAELAGTTPATDFIARCLDDLVERQRLAWAAAVIDDDTGGRRTFISAHQPPGTGFEPGAVFGRGEGVYTEPALADAPDDVEVTFHLCRLAVQLEQLRHDSQHDALTSLRNRRGLDQHLERALSRGDRYGWRFTLAVIDVDGLKSINDDFGHQRGDEVLRAVGDHLRHTLRLGDVAARRGGDEFAIVLHGDGTESVEAVLRRLEAPHEVAGIGCLHWSIGAAHWPEDGVSAEDLFRVADERLYAVKRGRRTA